jgi:Na+/H+ antiporter NhaC
MKDIMKNDFLLILASVALFVVIIFAFWFIGLIVRKKQNHELTNNQDFYIALEKVQEEFHLEKPISYFDILKRNYIGWILLVLSFALSIVDLKIAVAANVLCIIAFAFSEEIAKYSKKSKRGDTPLQDFYHDVKRHQDDFPSKHTPNW